MRPSTDSLRKSDKDLLLMAAVLVLAAASLLTGRYPLSFAGVFGGDPMQQRVFVTLRLARTLAALFGGFSLGVCGFVYQTVFHNPLASPDIIGVSSGASAGAALGILLSGSAVSVTACAFGGAVLSVCCALLISSSDKSGGKSSIVLAGIAVHAAAQAALMCLKLCADPERQLSAIEFWIMGSFAQIRLFELPFPMLLCMACVLALFLLHRQTLLLSAGEDEARMLGADVFRLRFVILMTATLSVAAVVSLVGIISFAGLLAPHSARLLTGRNDRNTLFLSGLFGSAIVLGADILARSAASVELPVSIFTSLLGAPFLVFLCIKKRKGDTA